LEREVVKRFVMNREGIGFFKSILESYEDVGIFSVIDGNRGLVELIYPSNFGFQMKSIVEDMANYGIFFQEVAHGQC
jgi:Domain of unknown function (DUF4911)